MSDPVEMRGVTPCAVAGLVTARSSVNAATHRAHLETAHVIDNVGKTVASATTGHAGLSTTGHTNVSAAGQDPQVVGGRRTLKSIPAHSDTTLSCGTTPSAPAAHSSEPLTLSCGHAATGLRENCEACQTYFRQMETAVLGMAVTGSAQDWGETKVEVTGDVLRDEPGRRERGLELRELGVEYRGTLVLCREQRFSELEVTERLYRERIAVTEPFR